YALPIFILMSSKPYRIFRGPVGRICPNFFRKGAVMKNDMPPRHKTLKKVIAAALLLLIAAAVFFIWYYLRTWPLRFHGEFDAFFGKGNWEQISSQTKESLIYSVYHRSTNPSLSGERPGKFH